MQARQKLERIIEAVRLGLEGDAAVEFLCSSGYAMTSPAIARNLRQLGGRKAIENLIGQGISNAEVLHSVFPEDTQHPIPHQPPTQRELFQPVPDPAVTDDDHMPLYETTKLTIRLPRDLYEAIRIAAKAENKPQNQLIIDILTAALSRMP
ncbi:MAG TPA: hypothetical protein VMZ06_04700 [Candidatus Bathyarchaeia archaeon]|nr:hypothetical protein [Candidatus Bathyarchaeia archaeon]